MIDKLKPVKVFSAFEKLCMIPHGSYNTDRISRFLEKYALDRGLECRRDAAGNIIIVKDASPGYENAPTVIIQGHMDMVCVCENGVDIDFLNDPIRLRTDGNLLYSDGTSLGGDDGIAVAYAMALLDYNGPHPRLELFITADEEVGMLGAYAADVSYIRGRRLINIDTGEQGVFVVGCAGGIESECSFDFSANSYKGKKLTVRLSDMHGGHSGSDIHKGYSNAIKLLGGIMKGLYSIASYRLVSFTAGDKSNTIPSSGTVELVYDEVDSEKICVWCRSLESECRRLSSPDDSGLRISCDVSDFKGNALGLEETARFLSIIDSMPDGVQKWSIDFENTVETSLNFGICTLCDGKLSCKFLIRSLIDDESTALSCLLDKITSDFGGVYKTVSSYPAWASDRRSDLCNLMTAVYRDMTGDTPIIKVVHAGLECGILKDKLPGLQCVSIGPDMWDIHTPKERLSVPSSAFMWDYLLELLKNLK